MTLPESTPPEVVQLLNAIVELFQVALEENLTGIYLHGSLAMGCFNLEASDVDFLVVVRKPLTVEIKEKLIARLRELNAMAPKKGLEMSVVTLAATQHFIYPTPYELHFSKGWIKQYDSGDIDLHDSMTDPDLAAHFVITKERGIALTGLAIQEVFGEVPDEYYLDSIKADAKAILGDITSDPVYNVLNLCRVLAYVKDRKTTSKREGGEWTLQVLPEKYRDLIRQALKAYKGDHIGNWDAESLENFGQYVENQL